MEIWFSNGSKERENFEQRKKLKKVKLNETNLMLNPAYITQNIYHNRFLFSLNID